MIPITLERVILATHTVDFRKHFDGLLAESYKLGANPYQGDCIVFLKRDRTQIRALAGDKLGLFLIARRFDAGRFQSMFHFANNPSCTTISTAELSLLFEGASFTVHRRIRAWC